MDDPKEQTEAIAPAPREPLWQAEPAGEVAPAPLRLTLMPSELIVEVTQANTLVGRHHDVNLRLPLPDVSRQHCRLRSWTTPGTSAISAV